MSCMHLSRLLLLLALGLCGCEQPVTLGTTTFIPAPADAYSGTKAGEGRVIEGIKFCWCPPGRFIMGSPASEPERRPGEDQVVVTLTKGFWMAKFETTQGQWKRMVGKLPRRIDGGVV